MAKQKDSEKPGFLFYYAGKPVFQNDETHKMLERCRLQFGGDALKMAQYDLNQVNRLLK